MVARISALNSHKPSETLDGVMNSLVEQRKTAGHLYWSRNFWKEQSPEYGDGYQGFGSTKEALTIKEAATTRHGIYLHPIHLARRSQLTAMS